MDKYAPLAPQAGSPFLTVTLAPRWYSSKAADQFRQTKDTLKNILKKFSDDFYMIAELTKQGNVHYHGYINYRVVHSTVDNHLLDTLKVLGLSYIKKIDQIADSSDKVKQYMLKHIEETKQFISNPIVKYKKKVRGATIVAPRANTRGYVDILEDNIKYIDDIMDDKMENTMEPSK